jgi:ABC-type glutathione transport system ATPase component
MNKGRAVPSEQVPPSGDTLLSVRGLRKEYVVHALGRRVVALEGVDLDVAPGEHVDTVALRVA